MIKVLLTESKLSTLEVKKLSNLRILQSTNDATMMKDGENHEESKTVIEIDPRATVQKI